MRAEVSNSFDSSAFAIQYRLCPFTRFAQPVAGVCRIISLRTVKQPQAPQAASACAVAPKLLMTSPLFCSSVFQANCLCRTRLPASCANRAHAYAHANGFRMPMPAVPMPAALSAPATTPAGVAAGASPDLSATLPEGVDRKSISNDEDLLAGTTAQSFTLQQSVDTALSTPLTSLRLRLIHDEAFRNLQVARAALDPQVRLTTEVRLADSGSFDNNNNDPIGSNDRFRFGAEATYPLINHGSTIDQLHIAQENLIAADANLVTQRRTIVDATIGTFYDLVAAQRDVHNRDLTVQALQDQLQSAQARYNLGTVTKGDVLQAQSALDSATADQSSSELSLQEFRARFAGVLGKDAQALSPVAVEPGVAPALGQSTTDVLQLTQKADPRVTALHAQTIIAQQNLAVTKAQHQITVGLIVGGGVRVHGSDGDNGLKPYYDVSVNVALPILDTAQYKNTVQSQKDEIQLRQLDEDQYNLTSKADDLSVGLAYQSASARILPATSAVANAEEAYRLREGQYNIGTATQEQVVSSFATLTTRRNALADVLAQRDLAARRIMLNEGSVEIQSLDNAPTSNPAAAVPTDTGAAAAAANGGATTNTGPVPASGTPPTTPTTALPATVPVPLTPAPAGSPTPTVGNGSSATPSSAPAAPSAGSK